MTSRQSAVCPVADTAEVVMGLLAEGGWTVSVAESCTGGLLSAALTGVPGSSQVFLLGAVTYSNDMKVRVLGVSPETLAQSGAVSEPVVLEMVRGVMGVSGSTLAVSISGVAGPGGGTLEKPTGTVCFGFADDSNVQAETVRFPGGRDEVRRMAVCHAMNWIRRYCESKSNEQKDLRLCGTGGGCGSAGGGGQPVE